MVGVSHGAVVQLQIGAVRALEDAMAESIHIILLLFLGVSGKHLFGKTYKPPFLCVGAWSRTDRGRCSVSRLATHRGIFQCRSFCGRTATEKDIFKVKMIQIFKN